MAVGKVTDAAWSAATDHTGSAFSGRAAIREQQEKHKSIWRLSNKGHSNSAPDSGSQVRLRQSSVDSGVQQLEHSLRASRPAT